LPALASTEIADRQHHRWQIASTPWAVGSVVVSTRGVTVAIADHAGIIGDRND